MLSMCWRHDRGCERHKEKQASETRLFSDKAPQEPLGEPLGVVADKSSSGAS